MSDPDLTPTKQDEAAFSRYEKARISLCERNKHDIESLDFISEMDIYVSSLREDWFNLDPDGVL